MMSQLRSEMRKLLTVRSTYFISLIVIIIVGIASFWVGGYKNSDINPHVFQDTLLSVPNVVSFFVAMVAILLMTHEYRYNTIVYTLTASKSRTKILLAKIITILIFVFVLSMVAHFLAFGLVLLGNSMAGHPLPAQEINYLQFFAKTLFFSGGFALAGLFAAALIRNQVATFAALFVLPNVLETLLNLILKENSVYLPFSALGEVISPPPSTFGDTGPLKFGDLSPGTAALVYLVYLAGAWLITWLLFLRRDAN